MRSASLNSFEFRGVFGRRWLRRDMVDSRRRGVSGARNTLVLNTLEMCAGAARLFAAVFERHSSSQDHSARHVPLPPRRQRVSRDSVPGEAPEGLPAPACSRRAVTARPPRKLQEPPARVSGALPRRVSPRGARASSTPTARGPSRGGRGACSPSAAWVGTT